MVGSVKRCLKNIVLDARIAFEELETILCEIELTLNTRPLTLTDEIEDELSTPSYLLHVCRLNTMSVNQGDRLACLSKNLVDFRSRYIKEYLLQLGEHFKYKTKKV